MFIELQQFLKQHQIAIGRDQFFDLLRRNKLLVRRIKRSVHTTNSKHHFHRYPNMVKDFKPLKAHELWVADITYIPLKNRFAYLFLITDAYSRKIVGFHVSDDMKVSSATLALRKALAQKPPETIVIHHSDRGIQYCSTAYVQLLQQHNAHISMTQNGDPYENAVAERVNGILKSELISRYYDTIDNASIHIARCITITITNEGTAASTGKYLMLYTNKKAHKLEDGKTIIKTTAKKNNYATNLTGQRTKNSFFSYGGYENIFAHAQPKTF